jgi:hypothetical protein
VNVDARACFLPVSFFADPSVVNHDIWSRAKRVRVGGMGLKHTFEVGWSRCACYDVSQESNSLNATVSDSNLRSGKAR